MWFDKNDIEARINDSIIMYYNAYHHGRREAIEDVMAMIAVAATNYRVVGDIYKHDALQSLLFEVGQLRRNDGNTRS